MTPDQLRELILNARAYQVNSRDKLLRDIAPLLVELWEAAKAGQLETQVGEEGQEWDFFILSDGEEARRMDAALNDLENS